MLREDVGISRGWLKINRLLYVWKMKKYKSCLLYTSPDSKIGNLYKVRGYVVETEKIIDNTSHLTIEIPVNDKTNITCSAIYCPIQELKILPGDEVILYAYLFDVDSKDSLPTFVVPRAELAE